MSQFLKKEGDDFNQYKRMFDEGNKEWEKVSSRYKNNSFQDTRQWFDNKTRPLRNKLYFAIRYRYTPNPPVEFKDGVFWVFVDSATGKVLLVFY